MADVEVKIGSLASGGDGVGREANGRVVFVPRTAPGDVVRVRLVQQTARFARGEVAELVRAGAARVEPACEAFARGCGGCAWLHVDGVAQQGAKQAIADGALRKLAGLRVHRIAAPAPALGWRRRARVHVAAGRIGLYADRSHHIVPFAACPQLEPALDAALTVVAAASPPDGELALIASDRGEVLIATHVAWPRGGELIGRAGIVGVNGEGRAAIEIEAGRGIFVGPWDFAQASHAGNRALIAIAAAALGPGPGTLVELYAGGGNLTRAFAAAGWTVHASDYAMPSVPPELPAGCTFEVGDASRVVRRLRTPPDAIVLDPPRTGAAPDVIEPIARARPRTIVYVSCDPQTLARDAERLVAHGYRATDAWPIDLMPQTDHVEIVLRLSDR